MQKQRKNKSNSLGLLTLVGVFFGLVNFTGWLYGSIYTSCPSIIINSVSIHSQKYSGLSDKLQIKKQIVLYRNKKGSKYALKEAFSSESQNTVSAFSESFFSVLQRMVPNQ